MTIKYVGSIRFRTHAVHISKCDVSDRIYCFKHTNNRCDLAQFDSENSACDYILEPLRSIEYQVVIPEDQESSN